ncbi:MAG: FKBP-type peptidyl-prolyl cis-trans isomerase [Myxococcota bacterium]|nr:FKBP-type peptidyl-prolyl cis-trans isomerase [Myxococcota bacterium]
MTGWTHARSTGRTIGFALTLGLGLTALMAGGAFAKAPETEDEKTLYFIGIVISGQPPFSTLQPEEVAMVAQGLQDSLAGNPADIDAEAYGTKVQTFVQGRIAEQLAREKKAGEVFLAEKKATPGAKTTDSGLIFIEKEAGEGDSPAATDTVKVHYHGSLSDGTVFDSSVERGEPAEFPLNRVIPCWTEGVAMMKPGGKAQLICPADIAYGDRGAPPGIPGGATLTFDVELIEVIPTP